MANNFFKIKNGLNLSIYPTDPTLTPPANSAVGDILFYNGKLYRYNGTAWVVTPGSGVTGLITDADVDAAAAIAGSKIVSASASVPGVVTTGAQTLAGVKTFSSNPIFSAMTTAGIVHNSATTGALTSSLVVNADVDPAAAIADTKLATISTAGKVLNSATTATSANTASAIVARDANGDFIARKVQVTDVLATANALNLGTSADTVTIPGNLTVQGTTTTIDTTNLEVKDKNILLNNGGTTASAAGAGISIEGDANAVIASVQYDAALASKFKLGAASSESEVITKDASQTLLSKKISSTGTLTGALELPAGDTAARDALSAVEGMVRYNTDSDSFEGYAAGAWSAIGGGGTVDKITQAYVAPETAFAVGDVLWLDPLDSKYKRAKADAANTAEVVGVVSRIVDATPASFTFEMTLSGEVSGLTGLTPGEVYFLSASTAGALTAVEPSVVGQVSLPVGVASSTTSLYVAPKRGVVVGGANLRTQIGLNGAALVSQTTNIQNVTAYTAGELSGWVYIDATTDRRFYIQVQFVKDASNAWKCAYQTTGDTPPAGFNVDVIVSGPDAFVQVQMPPVAGWVSGSVNFALNAPAVGATLPLQIDGGLVTGPVLGSTSGALPAAGRIGQIITTSGGSGAGAVSGSYYSFAAVSLDPGVYLICLNAQVNGTGVTNVVGTISTTSATGASIDAAGEGSGIDFKYAGTSTPSPGVTTLRASSSWVLRVTTTTTYYIRVQGVGTSLTNLGWATLVRIA